MTLNRNAARRRLIAVLLAACLGRAGTVSAGPPASIDGPLPARAENRPLALRGKWVLDSEGRPVRPGSFRRGLQPSGLAWRRGQLWSLGDQRSEFPGHLFRIDPESGKLIGSPVRLELPPPRDGENPEFAVYRTIPNSDFEGLCVDPRDPDTLYAVTEDKVPWVAEIKLAEAGGRTRARIADLSPIHFPEGVRPWRGSPNFRVEGLAVSDDGKTLYLAFERTDDDLPRILEAPLQAVKGGRAFTPQVLPIDFSAAAERADKKGARLNLNDIQFLRIGETACLAAVARDQERLLLIDLESRRVRRVLDLDLLDPEGKPIYWVSPEGLAFDRERDRLWIINDPDSVRGNYRRRDEERATKLYADYAPLLFELPLSALTGTKAETP